MFYIKFNESGKVTDLVGRINTPERKNVHNYDNDPNTLTFIPFCIHGKTYAERQNSLRDIAIDFQYAMTEYSDSQLSMHEWACVSDWFERNGKRYGLLTEFRENAIC